MPRVCPRPCGRLTTAAVFIAVGVVQILVGIILLRSRFSALLSGPDFMTASSNIGIGCVYGMAASVWKSKKKQRLLRRTAKNNVLASLLLSLITVNATTAAILIMGDGNKLLFAYMEALDRKSSSAFANEVLAGAYVTSVCSPIVCIVVAIVALSGSCFQAYGNKRKNLENALDIESPFGWISDSKAHSRPKLISDCLAETPTTSSDQSSRFSEDSVFSEKNIPSSLPRKSNTYIPSPVNTWAHKRKHILRNSNLLKKRSQIFEACLPEPELHPSSNKELIPRIKESSLVKKRQSHTEYTSTCCDSIKLAKEKRSNQSTTVGTELKKKSDSKCNHAVRNSPEVRFNTNSPDYSDRSESSELNEGKSDATCSRNNSFEYFTNQKLVQSDATYPKNDFTEVDDLALRHAEVYLLEKINPTLMRLKEKTLEELKTRMQNVISMESTTEMKPQKQLSGILKLPERTARKSTINPVGIPDALVSDSKVTENTGPGDLVEDGKKFPTQKIFLEEGSCSKLSPVSLPLSDPTSSFDALKINKTEEIHNIILNGIKSKNFDFSQSQYQLADGNQCIDVATSSCLECNDGIKKITNLVLDSPKVPSIKLQSRKLDVAKRMASITEIPSEEAMDDDRNSVAQHKSSPYKDPDMLNRDENSNITQEKTVMRQGISPDTVKRKKSSTSPSIKNMLRGIWCSSGPEAKLNILELIMDDDSLIGLSEEDLIKRTLRIRALRKAVAERVKEELEEESRMDDGDQACSASTE